MAFTSPAPAATAAIATHALTKRYGSTLALDGLDLTVAPGGSGLTHGRSPSRHTSGCPMYRESRRVRSASARTPSASSIARRLGRRDIVAG